MIGRKMSKAHFPALTLSFLQQNTQTTGRFYV